MKHVITYVQRRSAASSQRAVHDLLWSIRSERLLSTRVVPTPAVTRYVTLGSLMLCGLCVAVYFTDARDGGANFTSEQRTRHSGRRSWNMAGSVNILMVHIHF